MKQVKIDDELRLMWNKMLAQYAIPSLIFMAFFYSAYNVSGLIMPFSEFFEADPEGAKQKICSLAMVEETEAAEIVQNRGIVALKEMSCAPEDFKEQVVKELIDTSSE